MKLGASLFGATPLFVSRNPVTPEELLSKHSITLESYEPGQHSTTCPQCSHKRVKKTLKCLGVLIGDDGKSVCWNCGHCGWSGPKKGSGGKYGDDEALHYGYIVEHGGL